MPCTVRRPRRAPVAALACGLTAALICSFEAPPAVARARAADDSTVLVHVGGDRTAPNAVGPLSGVELGLYATEDAAAPVNATWAECTSDAAGLCTFTVPATGSGEENAGKVYFVKQRPGGVPAGWYENRHLRTGKGSGSSSLDPAYAFPTPALAGGQTYSSTSDFMYSTDYSTSPYKASNGIWQQSRDNPPLPHRCGLDVALIMDLSSSVGSALPDLKNTANSLADALVGTPSRMAVFSFDKTSPSSSVGANEPQLMPVSTQAGADRFKAQYADWPLGAGTNWDQGLYAAAAASEHYEVAIELTDGNPTYFGNPYQGSSSYTDISDTEGGVYSANTLKAKGTRVIALGVGSGVTGISSLNLRAISGTHEFDPADPDYEDSDYYQVANYAAAEHVLHRLVLSQCHNALNVVKLIAPSTTTGEDVTGAEPAGPGWEFGASSPTAGVGDLPEHRTTTDDGTGSVAFEPDLTDVGGSAQIHLDETQQDGYDLVTQGGKNATCVNLEDGESVEVTNDDTSAGHPSFSVSMPRGATLSCTVYNRAAPEPTETPTQTPPQTPSATPSHPHTHTPKPSPSSTGPALATTGADVLGPAAGGIAVLGLGLLLSLALRRRSKH